MNSTKIVAIFFIGACVFFLVGFFVEGHIGSPVRIEVSLSAADDEILRMLDDKYPHTYFSGMKDNNCRDIEYMLFEGGMGRFVHMPRCRTVPSGIGCVDWVEHVGEKWDEVLARRPAATRLHSLDWWELAIQSAENGRFKK